MTIVATLAVLGAISDMCGALNLMGVVIRLQASPDAAPVSFRFLAFAVLIVSVIQLICAKGLWRMRSWALWSMIVLGVIGIVFNMLGGSLISLNAIAKVAVVVYLFTQREKFA